MLVSVVVPVFNHRRFVAAALRSVADQTWPGIELVVVDDASTDGSPAAVEDLARDPSFRDRLARFRFVAADRNVGAAATIEHGIRLAGGEVLAILNSDDLFRPERIAACVAALDTGPDLAFTGIACIGADGRASHSPLAARLSALPRGVLDHPTVSTAFLGVNRAVSTGNLVFTRRLHRAVGGFRDLPLCHDWDFVLAAALRTEPAFVDRPLYAYRLHGENSFQALAAQAGSEGQAVVGRFIEAVRCGRVRNPTLAAVVTLPAVFRRLLDEAGPGVAEIAAAIDRGRGAAATVRPSGASDTPSPLTRLRRPADLRRPTILVVLAECDRSASAVHALNLGGLLRDRYDAVLLALEGGPLVPALQRAFGRVVIADPDRAAEPGALSQLVDELVEELPVTGAVCVGRGPVELHDRLDRHLVPTVLIARAERDLTIAGRATGVLAAAPGIASASHPDMQAAPIGPSEFSMALTRETIHDEVTRLRTTLGLAGSADDPPVVMGFGPLEPPDALRRFQEFRAAFPDSGRVPVFAWIGTGRAGESDHDEAGVRVVAATRSNEAALRLASLVLATDRRELPLAALDAAARGVPVLAPADLAVAGFLPVPAVADMAALARQAAEVLSGGGRRHPLAARQRAAVSTGPSMAAHADAVAALLEATMARMAVHRRDIETLAADGPFDPALQSPAGARIEARSDAARRYVLADRTAPTARRPFPGFHPGRYAALAMPDAGDGDPAAHFLRAGRPPGPWQRAVISPTLDPPPRPRSLAVAIHLHVHYAEIAEDLLTRLPRRDDLDYDLFVTTDATEKGDAVLRALPACRPVPDIRIVPNCGRDIGALLCGLTGPLLAGYDVVGHFHTKSSPHLAASAGAVWRTFLLEHLLGGFAPMAAIILDRFAQDSRLGVVHPDDPHLFGWNWHEAGDAAPAVENLDIVRRLAPRLGLAAIPEHIEFPVGSMFWARPAALAPLFDLGLTWDDFPPEPAPLDGSIIHAIERLPVVLAEALGYGSAVTHIPGIRR